MKKKCHRCSKPAALHITEIRKGVPQEIHLCEACAQQYLSNPDPDMLEPAPEAEAFAIKFPEDQDLSSLDEIACPNCGITFREFRSQGRFGCPHDYVAFEEELLSLLENIHGETQHTGKFPKRAPDASRTQYSLIKLRNELRAAVHDEQYEEAARIRDEIRKLEEKAASPERD